MGTRNLTTVIHDGKTKVAQYCQWDGYPSGQGVTVLGFLQDMDREHFIAQLDRVHFITDDDHARILTEITGNSEGWMNMEQSKLYEERYPSLHRNTGAEILQIINDAKAPIPLTDSSDFQKDGLFCEWAYRVNLDTNTLTVYSGGFRVVGQFDLNHLPEQAEFLSGLEGTDE